MHPVSAKLEKMPKQPTRHSEQVQPYPTGGRSIRAPEFQHRGVKALSSTFTPKPAFDSPPPPRRRRELPPRPYVPLLRGGPMYPKRDFFPIAPTYSLESVEKFNDEVDQYEEEDDEPACGQVQIWMMAKIDKQDKTIESLRKQLDEAKGELTKLKENTKDCICTLP